MNFFDAQDDARRASRWLVVVYVVATALIVAGVTLVVAAAFGLLAEPGYPASDARGLLLTIALLTTLFIIGATLYRVTVLSSGGGRVATQMGGTLVPPDTTDPLRRRLRNVVEEMAIASGVPVPEIYVLEAETGINAFAAGYAPGDAAIAVTRGTIELLDRDELQGVIAHEFSHVLNGDMRLNIRMMGVLFGIMVLGLIGRMVLRSARHTSFVSSRRGKGAPAILIIGLGFTLLGAVGVFFARLIKAGVSRQREYLADASAVQFTRQTSGIANALKKIGGYSAASYLQAADPEEVSHMLFGSGSRLFGWFATHPPLTERIQALEPSFDPADYPHVDAPPPGARSDLPEARTAGFVAESPLASGIDAAAVADRVGQPDVDDVAYAERLRRSLPDALYDAAHNPDLALLLAVALMLDQAAETVGRQMGIVEEQLGGERARLVRAYYDTVSETGHEIRLPLLEILFPALRSRPAPQLEYLLQLARRLIEYDGAVSLHEYCAYRILQSHLAQAIDPAAIRRSSRHRRRDVRQAAVNLLAIVADHGHDSREAAQDALDAGLAELGHWAQGVRIDAQKAFTVSILDRSLDTLRDLSGRSRRLLVNAIATVAAHDGRVTIAESGLLRAVCATLDCPLPPLLAGR